MACGHGKKTDWRGGWHKIRQADCRGRSRHALEPNTLLDLTDAGCFPEFVERVSGGWSDVLITSQYREPLELRILQSVQEILRDYETHACGWRRWRDRVFTNATTGWFVR
jgi:hypothetical protein